MSKLIELVPQPIRCTSEGQLRSCRIRSSDADGSSGNKELWFLYPTGMPMPDDDDADAYLLAALLPAMKARANIRIHGSVSRDLLANLTELQLVWRKWCPAIYHAVVIQVKHVRDVEAQLPGAVVAFSGGADAQFTTYRHARSLAGYATKDLRAGVFVHGFDIPLADELGFSGAARMAECVLNDLGLRLFQVKTNIRELWELNWEHYCGTALAAVFYGFKRYAGIGLIGAGEPYDALVYPWGSHPITDPLLGSDAFQVIHDGAGFCRSEKIKILSSWSIGVRHLRVCWAGGTHDRNCGRCEKCVRTQLNFLLAGIPRPECFATPLGSDSFAPIVLRSDAARVEWKLIRAEILRTGIGKEWLHQVEKVLRRKATARFGHLLPPGSRRRAWVKNMWTGWNR